MDYFESLPVSCPPAIAGPFVGAVYRLTADPPVDSDFLSHRQLEPTKSFHADECQVRSLSVFTSLDSAKRIHALPAHSHKKVTRLNLDAASGVTMKTGKDAHHHSWWRASTFSFSGAVAKEAE